jgi:hypothetical protein
MPGRARFQESLVEARATRGRFRGAHSIGMIVKLAAQTRVNAIALIIITFPPWRIIYPLVSDSELAAAGSNVSLRRLFRSFDNIEL